MKLRQRTRDYLTVGWSAPHDGGSSLSYYIVFFSSSLSGPWTNVTVRKNEVLQYVFCFFTVVIVVILINHAGKDMRIWQLMQHTILEPKLLIWHLLGLSPSLISSQI